jgi:dihydroorotase/N-acyl-D-amino-acid deacylase
MMRAAVAAVLALVAMQPAQPPFDIVIANGRIVDGTGAPWYAADLGIRDGRIAAIGRLAGAAARQRIDAGGRVVAPGFIDMLGQSELTVLVEPHLPSKIFQGITTEITGEGGSIAPLNDRIVKADAVGYRHLGITPDWRTLGQYFTRVEKQGLGINMATYVGATQVRRMVLGDDDRQPTPAELDQMKALVRQAMEQGAVGVSTSLQYAPAPYATTEELVALASEAARYGGIYATHMRSEGDQVLPAIDEAIRIGREAKIPASRTSAGCGRSSRRSSRRAATAWTSPPIPTPTRRGSTRCRRSCRRGRTMEVTRSCSSGSRIRRRARGSKRTCRRPAATGTTNGRKCPAPRRSRSASSRIRR